MGLLKTGIVLYGAHLAAKKIYGEKKESSAENSWCQRPQAPPSEIPQAAQNLQSALPNYAPASNVQAPYQPHQQWPEKAAIEAELAPKQCTCGAAQANQANSFTKQ
ncbi:hypothetical protein ONS95_012680 [Cadophora gregata]|uniref:uncharacterized protein n=1 Tax=Cadophora gregata TaxID=51156 RepID=UPI0026DB749A|nr:uncharacterized protein ONS95_012680 [Cadophora gregata]KAK0118391.1 hypothetical protein ONS95_012680 [Cadophora gregata]KAK0123460.1 hypothetical protein ONS96_010444 [Cadophora gregata f. sp. sojae]